VSADGRPQKDGWDKAEVLARWVSTVLLGILTLVITWASENIANSLKKGELVRSLIADLTTKELKTRRDIALIALHHSVGKESDDLVVEIADRIFQEVDEPDRYGTVAYQIIAARNAQRAQEIRTKAEKEAEAHRGVQRSPADPFPPPLTLYRKLPEEARLSARLPGNLVYIQFQPEKNREVAEKLRKYLQGQGLLVPGVEMVGGDYRNNIRFFHEQDQAAADYVAGLVEKFLQGQNLAVSLERQDLSARGFQVPKKQLEIWLHLPPSASP